MPYYNRTQKRTIILTTTHVRNCPVGRLPWHELDCQFDSCPRRQSTQVLRSPGRTSKKAHGELRAMLTIRRGRECKCEGSFSTATLATIVAASLLLFVKLSFLSKLRLLSLLVFLQAVCRYSVPAPQPKPRTALNRTTAAPGTDRKPMPEILTCKRL